MKNFFILIFSFIVLAGCTAQRTDSYSTALELMKNKEYDMAIEVFNKELEREKDDKTKADITYNIGFCFGLKGEEEKEIEYFKKALEISNLCQPALFDLGGYYRKTGDFEAALKMFEALVEINPIHEDAFYMLAMVNKDMGNEEEYLKNIKKAAELGSPEAQKLIEQN